MNFTEILTAFKREESPEYIMPLTTDDSLCNGILAWQSMPIDFNPNAECPKEFEGHKKKEWDWLWNNIQYDNDRFGAIINCKKYDVSNMIMRLRSLYLIYPDGTVNALAKQYMKGIVVSKIMKVQGKKPPAKKTEDIE